MQDNDLVKEVTHAAFKAAMLTMFGLAWLAVLVHNDIGIFYTYVLIVFVMMLGVFGVVFLPVYENQFGQARRTIPKEWLLGAAITSSLTIGFVFVGAPWPSNWMAFASVTVPFLFLLRWFFGVWDKIMGISIHNKAEKHPISTHGIDC